SERCGEAGRAAISGLFCASFCCVWACDREETPRPPLGIARRQAKRELEMTAQIIGQGRNNGTALGVACGIGAGALWGLVFLAPELARDFNPLQLTVGRYLAYGLIAWALLAPRWKAVTARIGRRDWLNLFWLALTGNTLYYILLSGAVQT